MCASLTRSGLTTATGRQYKDVSSFGKKIQDNKPLGGRLINSRAALLHLIAYNHGRRKENRAAFCGLAGFA